METVEAIVLRHYNRNLVFHRQSFIAFLNYHSEARELHIVFRKGQQYKYVDISPARFNAILFAQNRGNFIMHHVMTGKKKGIDFIELDNCAPATMERIINEHHTHSKYLTK